MQYDFTSILDRAGKDSIAVDRGDTFGSRPRREGFDFLPMWVADMNFPTVPTIQEAVIQRTQHPAFGYFPTSQEYYDSIIRWQKVRNGVEGLEQAHIGYENGVLGCVVSALQAFTAPGDPVLLHSPTYIGFTHCITDNGREIVHSQLKRDSNGVWRMDYEDMDRKLKERNIHFAVFCNPHNPCGRVWTPEEIQKAMEVYRANDVVVVSDEIWSDLILDGHRHTPTQSVSEDAKQRTIAVYAPSKTFNLAGLIGSYHIIYNKYLRDRVRAQSSKCHYNDMNVLSMHALIGAYKPEGEVWVDELCQVLSTNVELMYRYLNDEVEGVSLAKPEGTYMLYLDCEGWCKAHGKTLDELLDDGYEVGVGWQDGRPFHRPYAIRMNLALPTARVEEAIRRLREYVF
ncbi:MAG: aminotransferase class I/II-fold pyridoxal phosphate-dependent enzyme [Clostridiales bacterium]|nr:aminotransferase class I/II-fold pyridoxal phosphate-dependent enzyme [Clostridiales bacterium]